MKIKLTNKEIVALFNSLNTLSNTGSPKFTYALAKNRSLLEGHIEALREADQSYIKGSERAQAYQKAVENLIKTYSVDETGKPILRGTGQDQVMQRVVPAARMQEFMEAREQLDKEYSDVVVGADAHMRSMESLMNEEVEIDLRGVKLEDFPKDFPQAAMNHMFVLVEDSES